MRSSFNVAAWILAMGLPVAVAQAQTAPSTDPHHPDTPAPATGAAATGAAATGAPSAPSAAAAPTPPQMGMMMGDMRQMMQMMQQMMQTMGGGATGDARPGATGNARPGMMMDGNMPMMGPMMSMMPGAGGPPGPAMFRHVDGMLAFYRTELRITEAQAPQWTAFADAGRAGAKTLREAMQRTATQPAAQTMPDMLDRRLAMLGALTDTTKAVAVTAKALYAVLTAEQRKLADGFMAQHMQAMRTAMP